MWIKKNKLGLMRDHDVTDEKLYHQRRRFLNQAVSVALASTLPRYSLAAEKPVEVTYPDLKKSPYSSDEELTPYEAITSYNNFYEFGTDKESPSLLASDFPDKSMPWLVNIGGECDAPGDYDVDDLLNLSTLEERIYRLRCVEGWSMVIPWVGYSLSELLKRAKPNSKAKFVEFTTLYNPSQMPGQQRAVLQWPYVEGLRIDEAMHPLTMLAVGLYGRQLPGQNGAPIRLVVPWKYGFKSIKSIVQIRFVESMPTSAWMHAGPKEYGFYSNVNPNVDHPRWSQAKERRIGEFLKRKTHMFNGYGEQVAHLYTGMDLRKNF